LRALFAALQFLLITPAFIRRPFTATEMGRAVGFYPLVGLLLGAVLALVDALLAAVWPVAVRSALVLLLWTILTGALHLDGLLDACDGLLGGSTPERRLEIMRDERVGAYALAGGVLLFLILFSSLENITSTRWAALLLAPALGRCGISLAVVSLPYARLSGLGRDIKDSARVSDAVLAALTTVAAAAIASLLLHNFRPVIALFAAVIIYWLGRRFILRRISGMTGDTYGAINMLIEAGTLLVFAALG
jgi:adenosylcobinamide-GDP ribazoletransferase